ncbi:retrovirus-related Pol polyprotein from transposon 17.6 [Trichonephila clavata]|uniref:RNA-directed DNA polymerase n=1 Tax=Trichonephila clavata TaxID=2740835 RepID=A0A8X6G2M7_TRICU|nr:retrovirus-related Pol polyprotein from transposon 17.6 [Trichonephila clavata]
METILGGLSYETCLVYLDDIIIVGRSFEEHFNNIRRVLQKLKEANLKLSPSKCHLFRREVTYLGHNISAEDVRIDPDKISAVKNWKSPTHLQQLRSFLGLCTYYRKFVKDFSTIARSIHKLAEAKQKFIWTNACNNTFNKLKDELTSAPILAYPEAGKQFILDTDASHDSIGAVLSQEIDGQERVIAYFSKCLSRPERNYCVTRKELLAIVKAVEHFHPYLYGRRFLLGTDHASLTWLLNFKNPEGQIARRVLQKLKEANLKLSPSKCHLFRREVTYLGHNISAEDVRIDPDKISAVKNWKSPTHVHQLRSFLGLCTYYWKFVKDFSTIARSIHKLAEAKQKFIWTNACNNTFNKLKDELTSAPILAYPEAGKQFILDTDASHDSIGAVLSQEIDGQERVIAYFSKCLSRPERNYCVTRKELLAIVKAVEHFHPYLYGRRFLLRTDHASLTWLLNFKNPEGQIARWIQRLQEFDAEIRHRKGSAHGNADALSRKPCPESCK